MKHILDVYLHRDLAGKLLQDKHGDMVFNYAESWLANPNAMPLSRSLPLRGGRFNRSKCRGFFGGILPEARQREIVAGILGISARNDLSMLEKIGGECAGAVTFIPEGEKLPGRSDAYRELKEAELAKILKELPERPLMAGEDGIRLSLAGAQDKLAVRLWNGTISLPLEGAPSTHILKPAIERFPNLVFNEALCMKLAGEAGLRAAAVDLRRVQGIDYLLVERYDRRRIENGPGPGQIERLHQEDFCQALGIVSEKKYQIEGGPSLADCFSLPREAASVPAAEVKHLLDGVLFNFLIGNNDAHGKNYSLLYEQGVAPNSPRTRLAPLYDLVCTSFYPELSKKMAMKIGSQYDAKLVTEKDLEQFAETTGLARAATKKRVLEMASIILEKLPAVSDGSNKTVGGVAEMIRSRCEQTIAVFSG